MYLYIHINVVPIFCMYLCMWCGDGNSVFAVCMYRSSPEWVWRSWHWVSSPVSIALLPVCEVRISSLNSELSDSDHLASPPAVGDAHLHLLVGITVRLPGLPSICRGDEDPTLGLPWASTIWWTISPLPNITLLSPLLISETGFCLETKAHCTPFVGLELTETTRLGLPSSGIKGICH